MIQFKFAKVTLLLVVVVGSLSIISCTTVRYGTLVMYETPNGGRLPSEKVARVLLNDLVALKRHLAIRVDSSRYLPTRDTIELLPGEHLMQIWNTGIRYYGSERMASYPPSGGSCLQFSLAAKPGHEYVFALITYDFSDWQVDLVDGTTQSLIVHGVHCSKPRHYYWPNP